MTTRRPLALGLALAGAYLAVAASSFAFHWVPRAPVLDGLQPPPPYQWVNPPAARKGNNKPPSGATMSIDIGKGDTGGSVTTPDGQCQVVFDANSVALAPGQTSVKITMTPVDADTVGPPPAGFVYDSNAYQVSATYVPSGQAITTLSATIVVTYATNADRIIQWTGSGWNSLPSTPNTIANQLFAGVSSLGTFATAQLSSGVGTSKGVAPSSGNGALTAIEIIIPFGLIITAVAFVLVKRFSSR